MVASRRGQTTTMRSVKEIDTSLSPSAYPDEEHENFVRADARANNEAEVRDVVISKFVGQHRRCSKRDRVH